MRLPRVFRAFAFILPITVAINTGIHAQALAAGKFHHPDGQKIPAVAVTAVRTQPARLQSPAKLLNGAVPDAAWPVGVSEVDTGAAAATAGTLPARLGAPASGAARLRVEFLDRTASERARVAGVLIRLARATPATTSGLSATTAAAKPTRAPVTVDYRGFRNAYGADWASRLRVVALPECALSTPDAPACRGVPVASKNDQKAGTVTISAPLAGSASTLMALEAGASGAAGAFDASPIAPSSSWQAGGSTGDFGWKYPLRMPPALGGAAPDVTFTYSSQAVDGRTAATNNQPSMLGEGFDYSPGYVERRFKACAEDMGGTANNTTKTGDQCWGPENVVLSLGGATNELIFNAAENRWHLKKDDGTKVEKLVDASLGNGDDNGEYWRATTTNGIQYFFGRNRLPGWTAGATETKSTWTEPVAGNNPGETCHQAAFVDSFCDQAWRWNLDYVIDPNQNTTAYWYSQEENYYGRNNDPAKRNRYIRGGMLARIDYGTRSTTAYGTAPAQVIFTPGDRCSTATGCDQTVQANWKNWLDTPLDQGCTADKACDNHSPTFWSARRLASVTTQVWGGTAYRPVDRWTLRSSWTAPMDGSHAGLWLAGITHTGLVGTETSLPETVLTGTMMNNRVDTPTDNIYAYAWPRLTSIRTETGGQISVFYSDPDCVKSSRMPAAEDNNSLRCYPVKWQPDGFANPVTDYFHKYVVVGVTETDLTGGSPPVVSKYEYLGSPAWHRDYDDGLVKKENLSWGQWRGYDGLRILRGTGAEQTRTETTYFRGMDGDTKADGTTRSVTVGSSDNDPPVADSDALAGLVREERAYDGDAIIGATVSTPWQSAATASKTVNNVTTSARFIDTATIRSRTKIDHGSGWRYTTKATTYDDMGMPVQVDDSGDEAVVGSATVVGDETCVKTTYARNTGAWILDKAVKVESYARPCATAPVSSDDVIGITRNYYDNATAYTTAPTYGHITKTETLSTWTNATTMTFAAQLRAHYDDYGRADVAYDIAGAKRTTVYDTVSGGGVNKVTTSVLADSRTYTTTVEMDPAWGATTASTDMNGNRTDVTFDALGRTSAVWQPGRDRASGANTLYDYAMRTDGPVWTHTRSLNAAGNYVDSYTILDSLLRKREVQLPSATPGARIITETRFDSAGRGYLQLGPYANNAPPSGDLVSGDATQIYVQSRTIYDQAGRTVATVSQPRGVEQWRTSTHYGGDHIDTGPPAGGIATTVYTDARGHTVKLQQYTPGAGAGSGTTTTYAYNGKGELASVTDDAGNVWKYKNNLRGQQIWSSDPDRGETTYTFDAADRLSTVTDARGAASALKYTYDTLSRKTGLYDKATNAKRITWTYDTAPGGKGQPATASRWVGTAEYQTAIRGYNARNQSTGTTTTLPAGEGALAGAYTFVIGYNDATDGSVSGYTFGARGDLAAETVFYAYDPVTGLASHQDTDYPGANAYVKSTAYNGDASLGGFVLTTDKHGTDEVYRDFAYDLPTHRLDHATTSTTSGGVIADAHYAYDADGDIVAMSDPVTGDNQCFQQDYLKRLTEAWTPQDGNCDPARRTTDRLGGPAPYWQSWTYDDLGTRLSQVDHTSTGDSRTDYHVADGKHLLNSTTGAMAGSYTYDPIGDLRTRPHGTASQDLQWDSESKLTSVTESGATTSYIYDAGGNRLLRKDATTVTLYLGDTEFKLTKSTGAVAETRTYKWAGQIVAQRTIDGVIWLVSDHQGTALTAVKASTQQEVVRYQTPFAQARGPGGTWVNERGFLGGQLDPSGLVHLGARDYDPAIGRFVSLDPLLKIGDPQQMHGYAYSGNNPVTFSDPTGQYHDPGGEGSGNANIEGGGTNDDANWWDKFNEAHEEAIALRVKRIHERWPEARVTTTRVDNFIRKGSSNKTEKPGYADIICWDCDPGKVYIWEMKHEGNGVELEGPAQLDNYVKKLQPMIDSDPNYSQYKGRTVGKGPALDPEQQGPLPSNPKKTVTTHDSTKKKGADGNALDFTGVEVYTTDDDKKSSASPSPAPTATNTAQPETTSLPVPNSQNTPGVKPTPTPNNRATDGENEDKPPIEVPAPVKQMAELALLALLLILLAAALAAIIIIGIVIFA
ncbi:RHS repeat domain-containing protein [Hamadaea tsunoensis]|uniref:RHS repeat domain-containing protein n=1 Tax=Hamadaea tsunoensis TaxID=53368 RepID=UPI0004057E8E|nr:RHS repeat-associated core domain-containing protein [Hamadaea tsunoensis]